LSTPSTLSIGALLSALGRLYRTSAKAENYNYEFPVTVAIRVKVDGWSGSVAVVNGWWPISGVLGVWLMAD